MAKTTVFTPSCSGCPAYHTYSEFVPRVVKGRYLELGTRYCDFTKRPKVFKARDPQRKIPLWCPRKKDPRILRIYRYKSWESRAVQTQLRCRGVQMTPSGYSYAVFYSGTTRLNAKEFERELQQRAPGELLGMTLEADDVIEIDDGIRPYYFLVDEMHHAAAFYFDGERARKNTMEDEQNENP